MRRDLRPGPISASTSLPAVRFGSAIRLPFQDGELLLPVPEELRIVREHEIRQLVHRY